jgi:predicted  nucleic acid-binding Zn-ribbon protein
MEDAEERIGAMRDRAAESLRRAISTAERVIEENRRLAEMPGHEESAAQRIAEGEDEIVRMEQELAELESRRSGPPEGSAG